MGIIMHSPVDRVACPKCGAQIGDFCKTPKGRTSFTPHVERNIAMNKMPDKGIKAYTGNNKPDNSASSANGPVLCWLCKKPIIGKVAYQGGSQKHPSHRKCLVSVKPRNGGI
jgi:hypothetical protein